MKERLTSMLLVVLAVHLILSMVFIVNRSFLINTRISKVYRPYLIPGPFFGSDRIINSYSLFVSWKLNGQWSHPISPSKDNFDKYNERLNPTDIYRSRFERALYQGIVLKPGQTAAGITLGKDFHQLKRYLTDRYVPREADSIRLLFTRRQAVHFKSKLDTLFNIAQP